MAEGTRAEPTRVDVSALSWDEEQVAIPAMFRGSKYPWAELLSRGTGSSFFIPVGTRDEANSARTSVLASGRNYFAARELPFTVICRTMPGPSEEDEEEIIFGVRSWLRPVEEDEADEEGLEEEGEGE